jgi:hypothetical protein
VKLGPCVIVGGDKVLDLHLFKLAGAEDKVAGRDLVPESLANLKL